MKYLTRPLSDRAWLRPDAERRNPQFKVTWSQACDLLERELFMLDADHLVIEVDVREQDLRLDGTLRANARAAAPAAIVSFESRHGALMYRSDQYCSAPSWRRTGMQEGWQHNVYAVALTLEALRAVDRYGAASSGEQYRGYRRIGGGQAPVSEPARTRRDAALILAHAANPGAPVVVVQRLADLMLDDPSEITTAARKARRLTHPDISGDTDTEAFHRVEAAIETLRGAR